MGAGGEIARGEGDGSPPSRRGEDRGEIGDTAGEGCHPSEPSPRGEAKSEKSYNKHKHVLLLGGASACTGPATTCAAGEEGTRCR